MTGSLVPVDGAIQRGKPDVRNNRFTYSLFGILIITIMMGQGYEFTYKSIPSDFRIR
ncbi:hypothetical protein ACP8HZ_01550 [Francisella noatunensis]